MDLDFHFVLSMRNNKIQPNRFSHSSSSSNSNNNNQNIDSMSNNHIPLEEHDDTLHFHPNSNHPNPSNNNNNNKRQNNNFYEEDDTPLIHRSPINYSSSKFPYCIVWGPLPLITWLFPFIGHMGICDSQGRIHDFAGPYTIGCDHFMTGKPTKYVQLNPEEYEDIMRGMGNSKPTRKQLQEKWDNGIAQSDEEFSHQMHNICCNNCHHHSSFALQSMGIQSYNTQMKIWWLTIVRGKFTGVSGFIKTYLPFILIVLFIAFLAKYA